MNQNVYRTLIKDDLYVGNIIFFNSPYGQNIGILIKIKMMPPKNWYIVRWLNSEKELFFETDLIENNWYEVLKQYFSFLLRHIFLVINENKKNKKR